MNKQVYNKIMDSKFEEILKPMGFKRNGIHYYLHESPLIMQIQNGWKFSSEMLFAFTFDYLTNTRNENGKIKVSKFLSNFPISIPPHILKQQYKSHKTVYKFKYDLNFYSRKMSSTRAIIPLDWGLFVNEFPKSKYLTKEYIEDSFDVLLNEGMKLKDEVNSEIAFWAMSKYPNHSYNYDSVNKMKEEIKNEIIKNGKSIPKRESSFLERMQIKYHYRKK